MRLRVLIIFSIVLFWPVFSFATEYTGTNFKVLDPILSSGWGEQSTSNSYKLIGAIGQISIGLSESTAYGLKSGFLYWSEPAAAAAEEAAPSAGGGDGIIMTLLRQFVPYEAPAAPPEILPCAQATDLNCDGKIGLADFSIFLYLGPKPAPNPADFNKDKRIDARDLSILFFKWTERLFAFVPDKKLAQEEGSAKEVQQRFAPPESAVVSEILAPEKEAEAPAPNIFEKATQFVGQVFEKIANFFKSIF